MFQAEKLLISNVMVKLTVSLNPSNATCTLTYNGVSYTTTQITVPQGSTVSYSIYHATYGSKTGSVTLNTNKTLTCVGTYSVTPVTVSWSSPHNLTSNTSNTSFQVSSSSEYHTASWHVWHAFDGTYGSSAGNNGGCFNGSSKALSNQYWLFYTPTPVKITSMTVENRPYVNCAFATMNFYGGDTSSCNNLEGSYTNSTQTAGSTWTCSWGGTNYYKYHQLYVKSCGTNGTAAPGAREVWLSGYTQSSSYSYYWNITET